jgi:hypothetical protein
MRNIENRLRKVEAKLHPPKEVVVEALAMLAHVLPRDRVQNLAPGEHVVVDWYTHVNNMLWGRQRIATDPADQGRKCKWGGYLLDVIQELHQACPERERTGSCHTCRGTSVAECRPQSDAAHDTSTPWL